VPKEKILKLDSKCTPYVFVGYSYKKAINYGRQKRGK